METRRDRWVTGVGAGLAVFLIGGTQAPGEAWWGIALVAAALAVCVGIAKRV